MRKTVEISMKLFIYCCRSDVATHHSKTYLYFLLDKIFGREFLWHLEIVRCQIGHICTNKNVFFNRILTKYIIGKRKANKCHITSVRVNTQEYSISNH